MGVALTSDNGRRRHWAIVPLPPPVTGMTLFSERVVQSLKDAGPLKLCNYSHGRQVNNLYSHGIRVLRNIRCLVQLALNGRVRSCPLYLVANSRAGIFLTALAVFVGRKLGYRVFLHHHTYGYINNYNLCMAWIDRRLGEDGVHIVHCAQMIEDFRKRYSSKCRFEIIYPSVVSIGVGEPRESAGRPIRLGMLSNLTIAKGVGLAIDTFRRLHEGGYQVRLDLAGPIQSRAVEALILEVTKSYPDTVRFVGPVYGEKKIQFLEGIDVLIFPTRYNEESWGIVLNEALAVGAPVITFDRGCTKTVVGCRAGIVIDQDADFADTAAGEIKRWIKNEDEFKAASVAAIQQARYLNQEGERTLDEFVRRFMFDQ
jgi:glycosyltransferase involved in cell wall biosynthesis